MESRDGKSRRRTLPLAALACVGALATALPLGLHVYFMGRSPVYVALTFDTERDFRDWRPGGQYSETPCFDLARNALGPIRDILKTVKGRATFFVTGECAASLKEQVKFLAADGSEIGVHTHPSVHPAHFRGQSVNDDKADMLSTYPIDVQKAMVAEDKKAVEDVLGRSVNSLRAGKTDLSDKDLGAMAELGFTVFSDSIREPGLTWVRRLRTSNGKTVVDVPITHTVQWDKFHSHRASALKAITRKWLAPEDWGGRVVHTLSHPMEFADPELPAGEALDDLRQIAAAVKATPGARFATLSELAAKPELSSNRWPHIVRACQGISLAAWTALAFMGLPRLRWQRGRDVVVLATLALMAVVAFRTHRGDALLEWPVTWTAAAVVVAGFAIGGMARFVFTPPGGSEAQWNETAKEDAA